MSITPVIRIIMNCAWSLYALHLESAGERTVPDCLWMLCLDYEAADLHYPMTIARPTMWCGVERSYWELVHEKASHLFQHAFLK